MLVVKEIFGITIQGEGIYAGVPSVFVRFGGCNMWSGNPETRAQSLCPFCDTDFEKGYTYTPNEVLLEVQKLIGNSKVSTIVLTGGEPLLQRVSDLTELVRILNKEHYSVHLETNGTLAIPLPLIGMFDHITVSPKLPLERCKIQWKEVGCVKVLYPHPNPLITPEAFADLNIPYKYLQPIDVYDEVQNKTHISNTVSKVKELGSEWAISLQLHKILNER